MIELAKEICGVIDIPLKPRRIGALKINRSRSTSDIGTKKNVNVTLDPARLFGVSISALLSFNEEATINFLEALYIDGEFPQQELLKHYGHEADTPENTLTIDYGGSGTFFADMLYRIKRSELV